VKESLGLSFGFAICAMPLYISFMNKFLIALVAAAAIGAGYYIYTDTGTAPFGRSATTTIDIATTTPAGTPRQIVKVGAVLPLSGVQAIYGQGIREGLDLAADGVNATNTFSTRVEIAYEDTQSDVTRAVSAVHKLAADPEIKLIITALSPVSLAAAPIAQTNKVTLFTMASIATPLNTAGEYVFKNDDTATKMGAGLADAVAARAVPSIGILYGHYNDAVVEFKDAFISTVRGKNISVTGTEGFNQDTTDFKTQLQKLIAAKPAALAILGLQRDCTIAIKQLRELRYEGAVFGYTCFDDSATLAAAGADAEGVVLVSYNPPFTEQFIRLTKAKFGHEPLRWSAEAFDGLKLIAAAAAKAYDGKTPITREALRTTLAEVREFGGIAGRVSFDKDGNASRQVYIKAIKNGKAEIAK
jgi:branched-chain amino acid transport system substrate-binding protein